MAVLAEADGEIARRAHALFHVMLETGLRLGSTLALDVGDADLRAGELRVRRAKWAREQVAYLNSEIAHHLRAFIGTRSGGPIFITRSGKRLGPRQAQRRLQVWLEWAGVRACGPHALRHSFAMLLYERTGDVLLVQEALGHRSIASTLVYARASRDRLRAALGTPLGVR